MINIKIKEAPKSGQKKDKPKLSFPDFAAVDRVVELNKQIETLQGEMHVIESEMRQSAKDQYFKAYSGQRDVPSTCILEGFDHKVAVSFTSRYPEIKLDDADKIEAVSAVLGEHKDKAIRPKFSIKVDGDKIPESVAQELVDAMVQLFGKYGAVEALTCKQGYAVSEGFHDARHSLLGLRENKKLDQLLPMVTALKKKGVI